MDEIKFETEFLNESFRKILGKSIFYRKDLQNLKNIVVMANHEKITDNDFYLLQEFEDGIQFEGLDVGRNVRYGTIVFTEDDSDVMEDIEKINSAPVNRLYFPSLKGLNLEMLDKLSDRFKYLVAGDALAYKEHFYTYYTKQEMKTILSKLEEMKNLIPENANDITKFMTVYKWIGIHAIYDTKGASIGGITKGYSHQEERENWYRITRSLLGVLEKGVAVCEGYSWSLVTCLNYIGIPARVVVGFFKGVPHGWIHVKIDGIWYNACLTGDYIDVIFHNPLNFCLRGDAYFKEKGFAFKKYEIDLDEKDEENFLEKCTKDYDRDGKGNLLNDESFFIDKYYKSLLNFYRLFLKKGLQNEEIKEDISEEREKRL